MTDLLHMHKLQDECPVMVTKIPPQIQKEIDGWVNESKKFKNSPLAVLKAHENVGYLSMDGKAHNSYQCSISPSLVDSSFKILEDFYLIKPRWSFPIRKRCVGRHITMSQKYFNFH